MNTNTFVCLNGEFVREEKARSAIPLVEFHSCDYLEESMHASGTRVQFFDRHYRQLTDHMKLLEMPLPPLLSRKYLEEKIERLLKANKIFVGAIIQLVMYRTQDAYQAEPEPSTQFLLQCSALSEGYYSLNKKGLIIDVFPACKKDVNLLSVVRNSQPFIYILASLHKRKHKLDDCVILNETNHIIETIHSNIILVRDQKIYTPSLAEGCATGIMREVILEAAGALKMTIHEDKGLTVTDLLTVDEALLVNAVTGIRWVMAFKQKRYYNRMAAALTRKINEMAFGP